MTPQSLRVIVFSQQDRFFIPTNIIKASKFCNIIEVVDNQSKNSFDNKLSDLLKWFGFFQCTKMACYSILRIIEGFLDSCTGYHLFCGTRSIKHVAKKLKANFTQVKNINDKKFVEHIRGLNPDLVISYSAPQIIKPELLNIPKFGIINLHGALLPNYRGCLPSFWYLYNDEKLGGATVHSMSVDIDDGAIIEQGSVDISDCKTMFQLMKKTKLIGGEIMVEAIKKFNEGTVEMRPNNTKEGSYFTWPTIEQARDFRKKGKRLI